MAPKGPAVITGVGLLVPGCDSRERLWARLVDGGSALSLGRDPTRPSQPIVMGQLSGDEARYLDELPPPIRQRWSREQQLHFASVILARVDSGLDHDSVDAERIGMFDGTSRTNLEYMCERLKRRNAGEKFSRRDLVVGLPNHAAALAAVELGVRGPACTFGASCASGALAIANAAHAIDRGDVDVAYATGHDTPLVAPIYEMYEAAGLLSREAEEPRRALRPFADGSGTVFGEGSVTLVLESEAHAESRGAQVLASVVASAHGNTGAHPMNVDTSGAVPARLVDRLLARAGLAADDVDFVVGHGNGVQATYDAEVGFMRRLFAARTSDVPLLSTKPHFGHMMAAASALDVAVAALIVHHGRTFSTLNVDQDRVPAGIRHHAADAGSGGCRRGITLSFGMGGQVAALLVAGLATGARSAADMGGAVT